MIKLDLVWVGEKIFETRENKQIKVTATAEVLASNVVVQQQWSRNGIYSYVHRPEAASGSLL